MSGSTASTRRAVSIVKYCPILRKCIKRDHISFSILLGRAGQTAQAAGRLAAQKLILELREDVLLKRPLLRVKARHGLDEPERKLLVHIVIFQMCRPHQRTVLPDHGVDAPKVLFHELISLREGVIVVHVHFLSL